MGDFKGFGPKALPFFKGLAFHQSKAWFDENRALYEDDVVQPMIALLGDLTAAFARRRIPLKADGKKSIFRLNRDIRFSKDKSPYKTHMGAVMTRTGAKMEPGLLYIHISPDGCFAAAGFHMPEPPQLAQFRKAMKAKPARFTAMTAALKKGGLEIGTHEGQLTRVPRGFEELKDGPLDGPVRMKSFIVEEALGDRLIATPKLVGTIEDFAARSLPLLKYGWEALA
jgi:uncharacterized protein (TIGR02453 family)